jgi:hypothetical protein
MCLTHDVDSPDNKTDWALATMPPAQRNTRRGGR